MKKFSGFLLVVFSGSVHPNDASGSRRQCTFKVQLFQPCFGSHPGLWPLRILSTVLPFTISMHTLDKKSNLPFFLFPLNYANYCFWNKPHCIFFPFLPFISPSSKLNQTSSPLHVTSSFSILLISLWKPDIYVNTIPSARLLNSFTFQFIVSLMNNIGRANCIGTQQILHNWIEGKWGELRRWNKSRKNVVMISLTC